MIPLLNGSLAEVSADAAALCGPGANHTLMLLGANSLKKLLEERPQLAEALGRALTQILPPSEFNSGTILNSTVSADAFFNLLYAVRLRRVDAAAANVTAETFVAEAEAIMEAIQHVLASGDFGLDSSLVQVLVLLPAFQEILSDTYFSTSTTTSTTITVTSTTVTTTLHEVSVFSVTINVLLSTPSTLVAVANGESRLVFNDAASKGVIEVLGGLVGAGDVNMSSFERKGDANAVGGAPRRLQSGSDAPGWVQIGYTIRMPTSVARANNVTVATLKMMILQLYKGALTSAFGNYAVAIPALGNVTIIAVEVISATVMQVMSDPNVLITSTLTTTSSATSTTSSTTTLPILLPDEVASRPRTAQGANLAAGTVVGLCCLLCCCRWLRVSMRPADWGVITLAGMGGNRAVYEVSRPQWRAAEAGEDDDGKVHVVWHHDHKNVEEWFREHHVEAQQQVKPDEGTPPALEHSSSWSPPAQSSPRESAAAPEDREIHVKLRVQGIDHAKLVAQPALKSDFEAAISSAVLYKSGVNDELLRLELSSGSVIAKVMVAALGDSLDALFARLSSSKSALEKRVTQKVVIIPNIGTASYRPIETTVLELEVVTLTQRLDEVGVDVVSNADSEQLTVLPLGGSQSRPPSPPGPSPRSAVSSEGQPDIARSNTSVSPNNNSPRRKGLKHAAFTGLLRTFEVDGLPAYDDNQAMEYWSATTKRWVRSTLRTFARRGQGPPIFVYSIVVAEQVRLDVPLDTIRRPLEAWESLEVFSQRNGGEWLPARVEGHQVASATKLGYRVRLIAEDGALGAVLERAPSARLRRRFAGGAKVEVYRGSVRGWEEARVSAGAGSDSWKVPPPLSRVSPGASKSFGEAPEDAAEIDRRGSPRGSPRSQAELDAATAAWTEVPITGSGGEEEIVPSYLLRTPGHGDGAERRVIEV